MKLLKPDELAKEFGVTRATVDGWVKRKQIPQIRINRNVVRFDLDEVIKAKTVQPIKVEE